MSQRIPHKERQALAKARIKHEEYNDKDFEGAIVCVLQSISGSLYSGAFPAFKPEQMPVGNWTPKQYAYELAFSALCGREVPAIQP